MHDVDLLTVGHAQSVHEFRFDIHSRERLRYLRSAAVHEHNLHAYLRKQNKIAHNGLLEIFVDHRVAAVLDDYYLVVILLNVRQRLYEYFRFAFVGKFHIPSDIPLRQVR